MQFTFPLYLNDGTPRLRGLSPQQIEAITRVAGRIDSGEYRLVPVACLCGDHGSSADDVISEKDRYGFAFRSLLCRRCGLVRSATTFDPESCAQFYRDEYRAIYSGGDDSPEQLFDEQERRGQKLYDVFKREVGAPKGEVFEVGCGAGGILYRFQGEGCHVKGCDFEGHYLDYGRSRGLSLECAGYETLLAPASVDVLILSHVLEHFSDPVEELLRVVSKIRAGGHLIVEVPGMFKIHSTYFSPLLYLQNAHVFSFNRDHLNVLFTSLGLETVSASERCIFILRKPPGWRAARREDIYHPCLARSYRKVRMYLWINHVLFGLGIHPCYWASKAIDAVGARAFMAGVLRRF
ncbi:MAG: class I SAM-dependent methyltransferase [Lentisphaerae bacterium]|nr:class I SAM-dependent methyltransferase [Lentisphaerota bacterium]